MLQNIVQSKSNSPVFNRISDWGWGTFAAAGRRDSKQKFPSSFFCKAESGPSQGHEHIGPHSQVTKVTNETAAISRTARMPSVVISCRPDIAAPRQLLLSDVRLLEVSLFEMWAGVSFSDHYHFKMKVKSWANFIHIASS